MRSLGGSGLLGLAVTTAALSLSAGAAAAPVVVVPTSARVGTVRGDRGNGLCAQFMKATESGPITMAETADLLDGKAVASTQQVAPAGLNNHSSSFFSVITRLDYTDATGPGGRFQPSARFPWTTGSGGICRSQQVGQATPMVNGPLAMRARGLIEIVKPGLKTIASGADDGILLTIGGAVVGSKDVSSGIVVSTRRASFAEAGIYPFEVLYRDGLSQGELEVAIADEEIVFLDNDQTKQVAPGTPGADDLSYVISGTLPAAFLVVGALAGPQLFLTDADAADMSRCGALVGKPSDVCSLPGATSCGNGTLDLTSDGATEACDDGNATATDGCSATCTVEPGYVCNGLPSRCDLDPDGDGIGSGREQELGLSSTKKDTDGDGLFDGAEHPDGVWRDTDGDGIADGNETDDDGDGIPTSEERARAAAAGVPDDLDGDKFPNWRDVDADGDGFADAIEGTMDLDGDGRPDFLDPADSPPQGGNGGAGGDAGQAGAGGVAGQAGVGGVAGQAGTGGVAGQAGAGGDAGQAGAGGDAGQAGAGGDAGQAGAGGDAGQAGAGGVAGQAGAGGVAGQAGAGGVAGQAGAGGVAGAAGSSGNGGVAAQSGSAGAGQAGASGAGQAGTGGAGQAGAGGKSGASGRDFGLGSAARAGSGGTSGIGTGGGDDDSDGGCSTHGNRPAYPLPWLVLAVVARLVRRRR